MKDTQQLSPHRWLVIRLDRIGDLVLSLPTDTVLTGEVSCQVTWWVPPGLGIVASLAVPPRQFREVARQVSWREFSKILQELRSADYSGAIVLHAPWWVSLALWLARVPVRAGVRSQWHSFLFLNRTFRQKRSLAEHSELEYGFQLMEQIFGLPPGSAPRSSLRLRSESETYRKEVLARLQLNDVNFVVLHPGMLGSARNWPAESYLLLAQRLAQSQVVVITGTAGDEPYLAPLRSGLKQTANIRWLDGKLNFRELIAVLQTAKAVIAPSTGVLHLAASTGRPTLGLYSPVRVQHPRRWGPMGPRTVTLVPSVACPGTIKCVGGSCAFYDCMKEIEVSQVLDDLKNLTAEP